MLIGLAGGLVYSLLVLVYRLDRLVVIPAVTRHSDAYKVEYFDRMIVLAILIQAATAAVASARARQLGELHGLLGGFIAALVMSAGFLVVNLAFGGAAHRDFVELVVTRMVNRGGLVVVPMALAVSALIGWLRQNIVFDRLGVERIRGAAHGEVIRWWPTPMTYRRPVRTNTGRIYHRLTFKAHILETGTESYRSRTTRARPARLVVRAGRPRTRTAAADQAGATSD
jgi:hypothetical protein